MLFVYNSLDYHLIGDFPLDQYSDFSVRANIFLPAGGMLGNTTHEDPVTCYYWSTKLKSSSDAYYLLTSSTNLYISYNNHRYFGDSIRPVR